MELALYHPDGGFYASGGGAGRRADFLTSPETGPLFGAVVARALDAWWSELGHPDPFVVAEVGAGVGTLARDVLAAGPACGPALRYVLVERSAALRSQQARHLVLDPPVWALGPVGPSEGDYPSPVRGVGPVATSLAELPAQRFAGVVLANELLDNLPFRLLERTGQRDGWSEILVGEREGRLVEVPLPAPERLAVQAERHAPDAPAGGRIPLQEEAGAWLRHAVAVLERGRIAVLDYADTTPSLARRPWRDWVRTYRAHGRGAGPLEDPGNQDITCEVAVDQLSRVRPPSADRTQAEFLTAHGLEQLVEEARAAWRSRAAVGDLAAVRSRSRLTEAAAVAGPTGLGAHRVLEWVVG